MGEPPTAPRSIRREGAAQTVGTLVTPLDWVLLVMVCIGAVGATISYIHAYHPRRLKRETQHIPMISPLLPAGLELDQRMAEEFMGLIPCGQWKGPYLQQGAHLWEHTGPRQHRCYRRGDPAPYSRLRLGQILLTVNLGDSAAQVWGNALQLEQILVNPLTNASDALDAAPVKRITITTWSDND